MKYFVTIYGSWHNVINNQLNALVKKSQDQTPP